MKTNKNRSLDPTNLILASMWHRTMETLYDCLHEADRRGLSETIKGVRQCNVALTLVNRKSGGRFKHPIVVTLPVKE